MTMAISLAALVLSVASLAFSFYQWHRSHNVNKLDKINGLLRRAYNLRENVEDVLSRMKRTDGVEEHLGPFFEMAEVLDGVFKTVLSRDDVTLEDTYRLEKTLIDLELEHSLLVKQIDYLIDYNEELKASGFPPIESSV